jgi:hypothetical protein
VFDQGHTVDWSGVTAPSDITTISAALTEEAFVCGDAAGNLYKLAWDGSQYVASDIGQTDATGTAADLIRDDRLNTLVFGSDSTWQSFKVLNFDTIIPIDLQPSVQIGIGPLANLSPRYRLLIPTVGLSGGGVYEYSGGSWTLRNTGLPATTLYHRAVAADPNDPNIWYTLVGTNSTGNAQVASGELVGSDGSTGVLWRWDGTTWSNVSISATSVPTNARIGFSFAWRGSGWTFVVAGPDSGLTATGTQVYRGVGTTQGTTASESGIRAYGLTIMADGVLVVGSQLPLSDDNIWHADGSSLIRPGTASGEDRDYNSIAAYPIGTRLIAASIDNQDGNVGRIYATENYRTTQPSLRISTTTGYSAAVTTDERVYVAGGFIGPVTGIAEITDLFGTPSVSVVAASGVSVGRIGMDNQTRTLVAALNSAKTAVHLWDGTTETTIDASSLPTADLADFVEPIQ